MWEPGADTYRETPLMAEAVACINALGPAFVVCTGDLVDLPGNETQFAAARRQLDALERRIPFYPVPGNHDVGDHPTPAALDWDRRRCGRDWYSFDHADWHFIGLNSSLLGADGLAGKDAEAQWAWLEADLARNAAGGGPAVVFLHHPLFLESAGEPDGYFNLPGAAREPLLELLRRHDVRTVLAGHLHSLETAGKMDAAPTGNARAIRADAPPIVRMTNTYIDNGRTAVQDLFAGVDQGIYACDSFGGQTEFEMFTFAAGYGYRIENGQKGELLRDVTFTGNVFETLAAIDAFGNDLRIVQRGGGCGKGGQMPLPVGFGSPHIRIRDVVVGGA